MEKAMSIYTCPTCGSKMERDLLLFIQHTDQHIVEELKKQHPNWITTEGYCPKCVDYFKQAFGKKVDGTGYADGQSAAQEGNIGSAEKRKRVILGILSAAAGVCLYAVLILTASPRIYRVFLFIPFFGAALGFLQARRSLCVIFASTGTRKMSDKEEKVSNLTVQLYLRYEASKITMYATLLSLGMTLLALQIP